MESKTIIKVRQSVLFLLLKFNKTFPNTAVLLWTLLHIRFFSKLKDKIDKMDLLRQMEKLW